MRLNIKMEDLEKDLDELAELCDEDTKKDLKKLKLILKIIVGVSAVLGTIVIFWVNLIG